MVSTQTVPPRPDSDRVRSGDAAGGYGGVGSGGIDRGLRVVLRRVDAALAGGGETNERLDAAMRALAEGMVAETCSLYLRRGDAYVLMATHGLNRDAVGQRRLASGEGLVGEVAAHARSVNLPDARAHPSFVHRRGDGEENLRSFFGAPLIREGRVEGVLALRNRSMRLYAPDEVDAITAAAVIMEAFAGRSGLFAHEARVRHDAPGRLRGLGLSGGLVLGHVVHYRPRMTVTLVLASDPARERARLDEAMDALRRDMDGSLDAGASASAPGAHADALDVLEAWRLFVDDRSWRARLDAGVAAGLSAEAAVERVRNENRARFPRRASAYLRDRLHDLDDVSDRLVRHLCADAATQTWPQDAVVVARVMGPAALLGLDRTRVRGLVFEEGAPSAHATVVARALGIALVGRIADASARLRPGALVIVDGGRGVVYPDPPAPAVEAYRERMRGEARRRTRYRQSAQGPLTTRDGAPIALFMNAGLSAELDQLEVSGAGGIGLFRTEFQFMVASRLPRLDEQAALYRRVLDAAGDKPVVFRTLDVGGDKVLPWTVTPQRAGSNPALGWRALRMGLDRPALLRYQLRALLAAAAGRTLRVCFPMVTTHGEFVAARALLVREQARVRRFDLPAPARVLVGVMVEVPALVWQLGELARDVDFVSVGSNDLLQFFFASDRADPRLAGRYGLFDVAALRMLGHIARACRARAAEVTVCGEAAGGPLEALALVGLGFRRLSMAASAIGPVRAAVGAADAGALTALLESLCADSPDRDGRHARAALDRFARAHDIPVGDDGAPG